MDKLSDNERKFVRGFIAEMVDEYKVESSMGDKKDKIEAAIHKRISPRSVLTIMEMADKFKNTTGQDKKDIVLYVIEQVIESATGFDIDMDEIKDTIDLIVDISRGKAKLHKVRKLFRGCCLFVSKKYIK